MTMDVQNTAKQMLQATWRKAVPLEVVEANEALLKLYSGDITEIASTLVQTESREELAFVALNFKQIGFLQNNVTAALMEHNTNEALAHYRNFLQFLGEQVGLKSQGGPFSQLLIEARPPYDALINKHFYFKAAKIAQRMENLRIEGAYGLLNQSVKLLRENAEEAIEKYREPWTEEKPAWSFISQLDRLGQDTRKLSLEMAFINYGKEIYDNNSTCGTTRSDNIAVFLIASCYDDPAVKSRARETFQATHDKLTQQGNVQEAQRAIHHLRAFEVLSAYKIEYIHPRFLRDAVYEPENLIKRVKYQKEHGIEPESKINV